MGGHVGMSSEEGKGTRFWLEIPLTFGSGEDLFKVTSLKNKKILVIGTSHFCVNYNETLSEWGAEVTTCKEAPPSEVKKLTYDLVVTNSEDTARDMFDCSDKLIYISQGIMENSLTCDAIQLQEPLRPSVFHQNVVKLLGLDK